MYATKTAALCAPNQKIYNNGLYTKNKNGSNLDKWLCV